MKHTYIYATIIIVLLSVYAITLPTLKKQKQYIQYLSENYALEVENKNMYKNIIAHFFEKNGEYESDIKGEDENGKTIQLSQLIPKDSSVLIFKYKNTDCSSCIDSTYNKLKLLSTTQNLIIISDFSTFTSIKYIRKRFPNTNIKILKVNSINEEEVTPSVYILNHHLQISNFLYIVLNDKTLRSYINLINKKGVNK